MLFMFESKIFYLNVIYYIILFLKAESESELSKEVHHI